ncbi:MAG: LPS export ABC transporter permease LptF [Stagnimonas sp.]|nr:LPS export ABC transporter permease LptF [Stagnimonas sp.]
MILDRYLIRDAVAAWLAVAVVLLAIMLSTRFAFFLALSAKGDLPPDLLFKVVGLSSLRYLVLLVPVSLLLGVMLSLGRLYKDNEVVALTGCGVGIARFYRPYLLLGGAMALFTGALAFQISPWAARQADYLLKDAKRLVQYTPFEAGRFKAVADGRAVFYTSSISGDGSELGEVLAFVEEDSGTTLVTAKRGEQSIDTETGERRITLREGQRARVTAGQAQVEIADFAALGTRITPPDFIFSSGSRAIQTTAALLASGDAKDRAELHWRIAAPLSALILVLLAVPLAHVGPRQGRYGKLVLGILVYLVYSNLLSLGQAWLAKDSLPPAFGLWWVHALFLAFAGALIWRRRRV